MESDWRWNVSDKMMWGSDWQLCARWRTLLGTHYYVVKRTAVPAKWWIYRIDPGQLPVLFISGFPSPTSPHFPYSFNVDPD